MKKKTKKGEKRSKAINYCNWLFSVHSRVTAYSQEPYWENRPEKLQIAACHVTNPQIKSLLKWSLIWLFITASRALATNSIHALLIKVVIKILKSCIALLILDHNALCKGGQALLFPFYWWGHWWGWEDTKWTVNIIKEVLLWKQYLNTT